MPSCRSFRASFARGEESDVGLGADDYVPKPCKLRELVARVSAALRRGPLAETQEDDRRVVHGDLSMQLDRHAAVIRDSRIERPP